MMSLTGMATEEVALGGSPFLSSEAHRAEQRSARSLTVRPESQDRMLHQRGGDDTSSSHGVAQRNAHASLACHSPQDFVPQNALAARCHTLQHGSRQSVIREHAAEEMFARVQKASGTLEAEVGIIGILRSENSGQNSASVDDITIHRNECSTVLHGSRTGELERICAELRSTISIATRHRIESDRLTALVKRMTEDSRDTVFHHTPCSGECVPAKHAIHTVKQQDELFFMSYDKNMKLDKDLKRNALANTHGDDARGRSQTASVKMTSASSETPPLNPRSRSGRRPL